MIDLSTLPARLSDACLDWDGTEMPDLAEPRSIPTCGDLREAITALKALEAENRAMREHFQRMIDACANYVEPTTYVARHPDPGLLGLCDWNTKFPEPDKHLSPTGADWIKARRDQAFISDMICMLDGPEQRAALATKGAAK